MKVKTALRSGFSLNPCADYCAQQYEKCQQEGGTNCQKDYRSCLVPCFMSGVF